MDQYALVRESETLHQGQIEGNQPGDPAKAAAAMIRIVAEANPPLHLLLGEDAYNMANVKIKSLQNDMAQWKDLTVSTGFSTEPVTA